ncbi:outer membrane lipoprotein-sorting protein [Candidatus Neomarinimicrobiota bacterium]
MLKNLFFALIMPLMIFAQTGDEIAQLIDDRAEPEDMTSDMTMVLTSKRGKTRTMTVHSVRKGEEKMIIWFLAPADDRGVAFLKIEHPDKDDEMRMWLPSFGKLRRIASSKKGESFMGSDLSYEDMTSRSLEDYTYELLGEDELDGTAVWKLQSTPIPELRSSYGHHIAWVRKADAVVLKEETYNRASQLQKVRTMDLKEQGDYLVFTRMFVEDVLKNHSTELIFENIVLDTGVEDDLFHERNLRRLP